MTLILIVAGTTLAASFICSLLEAVLYAVTPARIEVLRAQGAPGAEALERMRADIEEPIVAILTVNTIAHTVGAAWCGALVGAEYGPGALAIFAVVFTVLVLAVTEIVPKSLGVRYAGSLATKVVLPLQIMVYSVLPLVWIAKRAMRLLTSGADAVSGPSEEEVIGVARLAARRGTVRGQEHRWVRNVLRLDEVTAGQLRTPRQVVETVADSLAVADLAHEPGRLHFSRVPVTRGGDVDDVIGLIRMRDVFTAALKESPASVRDIMRPLRFVPESMPAHQLLDLFLTDREHMVGVLDEYGTFEGVVTLEDVLESMLGSEIVDEYDRVEDMQELARRSTRQGKDES
ncbi:MAG: hemolysin family protein [Planctomycetota bacterium]|nr:hemolysin family protein [Planctomycetota bacterium]